MEAEKEAAKIVQKARTYRTQKLKDARSEASKEIEELKKQKEEEFTKFQKENQGNQSESQSQIDKETQEKLQTINKAFDANQKQVVEKLLQRVTQTKAELHRNLQKAS